MAGSKRIRSMPGWLRDLRESDPNAFYRACKNGGHKAAETRKQRTKKSIRSDYLDITAKMEQEAMLAAAAIAAAERRDDLLPEDDY